MKFPVRSVALPTTSEGDSTKLAGQRIGRHLDDHTVDDPRQPRDQLFAEDRLRPLRGHRRAGGQLGEDRRPASSSPTSSPPTSSSRRASRRSRSCERFRATSLRSIVCAHPLKGFAAATTFDVPLLAGDHVTDDAGTGFVHTAPGHGREDFDVWTANARAARSARHQHARSPTPSTRRRASPSTRRASPASACSTTRARRATPTRP